MSNTNEVYESGSNETLTETILLNQDFVDEFCSKRKLKNFFKGFNVKTNVKCVDGSQFMEIYGTIDAVNQAKMKLMNVLLNSKKQSTSFTHLITLPFNNSLFVDSFNLFKNDVLLKFSHCNGVDEFLFQNPKKLHLTISVLSLETETKISQAKEAFKIECERVFKEFEANLKMPIQIKGLGIMNNDPTKTNVLYAKIENYTIQQVANRINEQMKQNGFLFKDNMEENVKLHITLMNTLYRKRKAWKLKKINKSNRTNFSKTFDSTEI